jgi:hypothetical protein
MVPKSIVDDVIVGHEIGEIIIKIDSLTMTPEYYQIFNTYHDDTTILLIGYNRKTHSFDIIDLISKKVGYHIDCDNDGPNGIGPLLGFDFITPDSIIIADMSKFCIINKHGEITWKLDRNEKSLYQDIPGGFLFSASSFEPNFNQRTESLIFHYYPDNRKRMWNLPIIVEVDILNKKSTFIDFFYPDYLRGRDDYNPVYTGPNACFIADSIIINFANSSDIFALNLTSGSTRQYCGTSEYVDSLPEPMQKGSNPLDYALSTARFFKIVFDPYRNSFYRTQWSKMDIRKDGYDFNTYYDKPIFLSVFDKSLNVLYETQLSIENGICPEMLIPTPEGLIVFPFKQKLDDLDNDIIKGNLITFK